jgi:tetratricopeptide (TPR) repeat protein
MSADVRESHRGFFFARRKRYDDALADFEKGAQLDPQDGTYAYGEGGVCEERGEYKLAIERYSEAMRINRKIANYYVALGRAHNFAGTI